MKSYKYNLCVIDTHVKHCNTIMAQTNNNDYNETNIRYIIKNTFVNSCLSMVRILAMKYSLKEGEKTPIRKIDRLHFKGDS